MQPNRIIPSGAGAISHFFKNRTITIIHRSSIFEGAYCNSKNYILLIKKTEKLDRG
jgi:hypothetical protein